MPAFAEEMVMLPAAGIMLDADSGPVINSVAHARIAGPAHENDFALAALTRHGCEATVATQGVIISLGESP